MNAPSSPRPDLVGGVVVRVVHVRARGRGGELVGERLAGRERQLGDERDAVHGEVRELDAVEVDPGRLGHVVRERDPDLVALGDPQDGPRPHLVVAERLDRRVDRVDLPLDLVDRELEHLGAVGVDPRGLQRLVPLGDHRELGVVEVGPEHVVEERRHPERPGEVADEAADLDLAVDVVLGPAGGQVGDRATTTGLGGDGARRLGGGRRRAWGSASGWVPGRSSSSGRPWPGRRRPWRRPPRSRRRRPRAGTRAG